MSIGEKPLLLGPEKGSGASRADKSKTGKPRAEKSQPDKSRAEKPDKSRGDTKARSRATSPTDVDQERYRIEVGRNHGVKTGNIVGAIANEAGLDGEHIGHIEIEDEFSLVDLPVGMPRDIFMDLKKVRVCGLPLKITRCDGTEPEKKGKRKAKPSKKNPAKKKGKRAGGKKPKGKKKSR